MRQPRQPGKGIGLSGANLGAVDLQVAYAWQPSRTIVDGTLFFLYRCVLLPAPQGYEYPPNGYRLGVLLGVLSAVREIKSLPDKAERPE